MKRLLLLSLLLVGCADTSNKAERYDVTFNYKNVDMSAIVQTKYFNDQLNYRIIFTNNDELCSFNPFHTYVFFLKDAESFNIKKIEIRKKDLITIVENDCKKLSEGSLYLDKNLYKQIDKVTTGIATASS